jgi:hypothetical protein
MSPARTVRPARTKASLSKAEGRFRELVAELRRLTVAFPHLAEAVDPEDLPIAFILKHGADRAAAETKTRPRRPLRAKRTTRNAPKRRRPKT